MKNKHQDGYVVEVTAPHDVESGAPVGIGAALFGVAAGAALAGERLALAVFGVFRFPSTAIKTGVSFAAGDVAYYDPALKKLSNDNTKMRAGIALGGGLFRIG
ncbi:MAG: hypothetical protein CMJ42_08125 [Phyllobacteriaceae bacterium]|nr:hypothetical protein [Phyllobacteriaceae bacterium]MBA89735.1 hypothetical protein [Phyllobacteriaceae bacterium]